MRTAQSQQLRSLNWQLGLRELGLSERGFSELGTSKRKAVRVGALGKRHATNAAIAF